jgi:hypothetical protein
MRYEVNYVGVDLGQVQDYSAVAILEYVFEYDLNEQGWTKQHTVSHLERFPLGTEYPVIVQRISTMFQDPRLKQYGRLIVDQTGVGRPVVDMLRKEKLNPIAVTITAGAETQESDYGMSFHVPKKELVSALLVLFQTGQLKILETLPDVDILVRELENFRAKVTLRGAEKYEAWREGEHDDLVLALSLAAWYTNREGKGDATMKAAMHREHRQENKPYNPLEYGVR